MVSTGEKLVSATNLGFLAHTQYNTEVIKVLGTPVSGQGGSLGTLTQKSTFPNEFCTEMHATDKVIQKNQNTAKKQSKIIKWRPKN